MNDNCLVVLLGKSQLLPDVSDGDVIGIESADSISGHDKVCRHHLAKHVDDTPARQVCTRGRRGEVGDGVH